MLAGITVASSSRPVRDVLEARVRRFATLDDLAIFERADAVRVVVNGDTLGVVDRDGVKALYDDLKHMKGCGELSPFICISWHVLQNQIVVCTEAGRCVRPLLVAGAPCPASARWADALHAGCIEYLDVDEIAQVLIATTAASAAASTRYTHVEIHPSLIMGVLAGSIPFSDHNQSPRNSYQCLLATEPVHMADGTSKPIQDLVVGDRVLSFDPETLTSHPTTVIGHTVASTTKDMVRVTTVTGRSIVTTTDHRFWTNQGWRRVMDFDQQTRVAVNADPLPLPTAGADVAPPPVVVLDAATMNARLQRLLPTVIQAASFSPLLSDSQHLPTLARIMGYMQAGGSVVAREGDGVPLLEARFQDREDATAFLGDVRELRFSPAGDLSQEGDEWCARCAGPFPATLLGLGLHLGARRGPVPAWIMEARQPAVKREFLASLLGAVKVPPNCQLQQVTQLLRELNVNLRVQTTKNRVSVDKHGVGRRVGIRYAHVARAELVSCVEGAAMTNKRWWSCCDGDDAPRLLQRGVCVFLPVASVSPHPNALIADIEVDSPHHCFFGGDGFAVHNSAMGKQAIGLHVRSYLSRLDSVAHVLNYPQRPLVYTMPSRIVGIDSMPCGVNAVVAIMTCSGYNQEDSVILSRSAVERGMFVSTCYKTFKELNSKNHSSGEEEFFCKPDPLRTNNLKPLNYDKLQASGFVAENTHVETGDVIIGKCMPQRNHEAATCDRDTSMALKNNESGVVDRNVSHENADGYQVGKVRLRSERHPTIGDKFCVPGDAEVLTERGWRPIASLERGDRVLQRAADGGAGYGPVLETHIFHHYGDMVCVHGETVSVRMTPDHRALIARDRAAPVSSAVLIAARDLVEDRSAGGTAAFLKAARLGWADLPALEVGPLWGDDAIVFLAAYASGGYLDCVTRTTVLLHVGELVTARLVDTGVFRLGVRGCVISSSADLYEWMLPYRDDADLYPPLMCMSARQSRLFADAFLGGRTYSGTLTKYRADQLQHLFVHAGYACDLLSPPERTGGVVLRVFPDEPWEVSYELSTLSGYRGAVYCIEVEHHVFYLRVNGKTMWTGNSSRHAQKGTVGMMYRQEDMPYTADGTVPDIIVNPHAIPSRMTIAQLMECLMGKACAAHGTRGDATPFTGLRVEDLARELEAAGMERYGNEVMHNPRTGEQMPCDIFIGPTYYQRLKHLVDDKCHCLREDHDVLTVRGWVPIAEVTLDDRVATLHDGKRLVYDAPLEVLAFPDYRGPLFHAESALVDLVTTMEHRMWVGDARGEGHALVPAKDIVGKYVRYQLDAQWDAPDFQFEAEHPARALEFFGICPDWVWELSARQAQRLVHSMVLGDGTSYCTSSERLADDVMRLCLHAGYSATKHAQGSGWRMSVIKQADENRPGCRSSTVLPAAPCPVYCLRVPSEVFYVRRNGKACWTGNSRAAHGPVMMLTRQPAEGRARDGGLRLGEMEIECNWAHGSMQFLKERFMECSDNFRVHVCRKCGMVATCNPDTNLWLCKPCKNTSQFAEVRIPYACKLLLQEVQAMSIGSRFVL